MDRDWLLLRLRFIRSSKQPNSRKPRVGFRAALGVEFRATEFVHCGLYNQIAQRRQPKG
ncbi:MAG: hypothetical protein ANABAC_1514 [Anaerolineae bacterium]|nr:MAG: hypothetical protein ANABAC_1514 [Anaerolineae bacterium]